jgi:hypothetical protein
MDLAVVPVVEHRRGHGFVGGLIGSPCAACLCGVLWQGRRSGAQGVSAWRGKGKWWSPRTTTTERVGRGTSNSHTVNRSASTGRFVTAATAARHPGTTITQRV